MGFNTIGDNQEPENNAVAGSSRKDLPLPEIPSTSRDAPRLSDNSEMAAQSRSAVQVEYEEIPDRVIAAAAGAASQEPSQAEPGSGIGNAKMQEQALAMRNMLEKLYRAGVFAIL